MKDSTREMQDFAKYVFSVYDKWQKEAEKAKKNENQNEMH